MNTLNAKEGMYLTQRYEVQDRVFVTSITGVSATYLNWRDATKEEKEEYEKRQEEIINDKMNLENGNN